MEELQTVIKAIKANTHEYSGTDAYWVNEYLVHRRGENEPAFYASLKLKSERTVGAEVSARYASPGIWDMASCNLKYAEMNTPAAF